MTEHQLEATDVRTVIERYVHEVLSGDGPAALEDLVSNDVLCDKVRAFRAAFPDLRITVRHLLVERDLVALYAIASGTHRGLFEGIPPTGRRWSASCTGLYRVSHGRIADFWVNWDLLAILEQLGGVRRAAGASA